LKKGTKSLQFNEATKEWFKTEVEKHTEAEVIITAEEVAVDDGVNVAYIYDDEWLIAYPGGKIRIISEFDYVEEFDSV